MEFKINRATLARLVKHVGRVVESRNTIPILSCLKLEANGEALTVTATDLSITATASGEAVVSEPGAVCVDAKLLSGIAGKAGGDELDVSLADGFLTVKSGRSRFKIAVLPATDYPAVTETEYEAEFNADLSTLFGRVEFAISSEEVRYYLNGIYMEGADGKLTAVATDGHRLAKAMVDGGAEFAGVIVPSKTVGLVGDGAAAVSVSRNSIRIVQEGFSVVSRLIDGTFPDYGRVIPANNDKLVTVDRDEMMRAADRVVTISSERARAVRLSIAPGAVGLTSTSDVGEAVDEVPAEYADEPVDIGFNSQYLRDMFSALPSGPVEIRVSDTGTPGLFTSPALDGWLGVIMPMRVG